MERQCPELWAYVLREDNEYRRSAIDQVVATALPESSSAEEVSAAVNAFIAAQLPQELTELLEKIVLHNSDFSSNKNLQNLLILTAIKANASRVMGYINRLSNFDGAAIAAVALENGMREEAFTIYRKFGLLAEAADTLLHTGGDGGGEAEFERAQEFAQRCGDAQVWRKLGRAQLQQGRVVEAIDSLIKAGDGEVFKEVVAKAEEAQAFEALADYLLMARKSLSFKDQTLDSELLFAYAMTDRFEEMEAFLAGTNTANVQAVGDRVFEMGRYEAAKLLFQSVPIYSKLASCFVRMADFTAAVEAARKAKNPRTWKEVAFGALDARDLRCAQTAGLQLIAHPDVLDSLVEEFERRELHNELIELLVGYEHCVASEAMRAGAARMQGSTPRLCGCGAGKRVSGRAHARRGLHRVGSFVRNLRQRQVDGALQTTQGPHEHPQTHSGMRAKLSLEGSRVSAHLLRRIRTGGKLHDGTPHCLAARPVHSGESSPPTFIGGRRFCAEANNSRRCACSACFSAQVIQKVSNTELLYRAVAFYLEEHPLQLCALLKGMDRKVDHSRVVHQLRKAGHLPLIQKYLQEVLPLNIAAVNEAMLELLIEAQDEERIRQVITECDNFDQLGLARQLESHPELGMRRSARCISLPITWHPLLRCTYSQPSPHSGACVSEWPRFFTSETKSTPMRWSSQRKTPNSRTASTRPRSRAARSWWKTYCGIFWRSLKNPRPSPPVCTSAATSCALTWRWSWPGVITSSSFACPSSST